MVSLRRKFNLDYLLLLVLGLGILSIFYIQSRPRLSDHDEILYTAMGRNIANGRGIISNLYDVRAILADGYPLADVHMPGHMFLLAFSFLLLGQNEYAAFFPSHIAYLLTGLMVYWAGRQLGNRWAAFYSAVLFFLFPLFIAYANTAFSELTLTLLATLYFVIWLKALLEPRWLWIFLLAVALIAGMIHHETLLVFLPPACYVLWRWPKPERAKAALIFGVTVTLLFVFVFLPLYLSRASYPHVLAKLSDAHNFQAISSLIFENLSLSFEAMFKPGDFIWQSVMWMQYLLVPILILALTRFNHQQKAVALFVIFTFVANFAGLAPFYPLKDRTSARVFMHLVPPALVLLGILIVQIRPATLKYITVVVLLGVTAFMAISYNNALTTRQRQQYQLWQHVHEITNRNLGEFQPQIILQDGAFRYAWDNYPATVIYNTESIETISQLQKLFQTVAVDAIIVQEKKQTKQRNLLSTLQLRDYLLSQKYKLVNADDGYFIFVKQLN